MRASVSSMICMVFSHTCSRGQSPFQMQLSAPPNSPAPPMYGLVAYLRHGTIAFFNAAISAIKFFRPASRGACFLEVGQRGMLRASQTLVLAATQV